MKGESRRRAASKTADERVEGEGGDVAVGAVEVEAELDELEVPVAELAPEELVDGAGGFVEAVVGERVGDAVGDGAEAGEDPAGFERRGLGEVDGEGVVAAERDLVA